MALVYYAAIQADDAGPIKAIGPFRDREACTEWCDRYNAARVPEQPRARTRFLSLLIPPQPEFLSYVHAHRVLDGSRV